MERGDDKLPESSIEKNSESEIAERAPPEGDGPAAVDNQGASLTCVRFAVSKAITNHLFDKKKIRVDQNVVMNSLIQITKNTCANSPLLYNEEEIVLQDIESETHGNKSWWKIKIRVKEENMKNDYDIDYDDDSQYVLGYSTGMHKEERSNYKKEAQGISVTKKESYLLRKNPNERRKITDSHVVYIRKRYIATESKHDRDEKIYECINSWGFEDHAPCFRISSPSIMCIFQIIVETPENLNEKTVVPDAGLNVPQAET